MNKQTLRAAGANVAVNLGLTILKLFAGIFGNSSALISDAIHSGADVLSAAIAALGVKLAQNGPDEKHRYGHGSFESIASLFLSIILLCAGLTIGYNGISEIISGNYGGTPSMLALIAAIISAIVKAIMCHALHIAAKKSGSPALKAEVWHLRTDILASVGCLLGIAGARFGLFALDSIAAIIVSLMVLRVAVSIMKDSINKLTDSSCDKETLQKLEQVIINSENNIESIELKTRLSGSSIFVDAVLCADRNLMLKDIDIMRQQVHKVLESSFPNITHCTICFIPVDKEENRD